MWVAHALQWLASKLCCSDQASGATNAVTVSAWVLHPMLQCHASGSALFQKSGSAAWHDSLLDGHMMTALQTEEALLRQRPYAWQQCRAYSHVTAAGQATTCRAVGRALWDAHVLIGGSFAPEASHRCLQAEESLLRQGRMRSADGSSNPPVWNHWEFRVHYSSLEQHLCLAGVYIRLLLEGVDKASLGIPALRQHDEAVSEVPHRHATLMPT